MIKKINNYINLILERSDPKKKKQLDIYTKFIFKSLNLIASFFLIIIFKIFRLKVFSSSIEALGHQILDLESFIIENPSYKFKLVISIDRKHIANKHFFLNYQKKKIDCITIENKFISTLLHYQKKNKRLIYDSFKYTADENAASYKILRKKFLENNFYEILQSDIQIGQNFLKKNNLINKKFVVIHARDNFYRHLDHEQLRNYDINVLNLSLEWLKSKDISIIRIGHVGSNRFKNHNDILDLTEIRDENEKEVLSVFLSNQCEFFIGASSGAKTFAAIFGKPILTTNAAPFSHCLEICKYGISIPKLYFKGGKLMKFSEIADLINESHMRKQVISNNYRRDDFYESRDIKILDNSAEDILEATKEIYEKTSKFNFEENDNQKKFRKILDKNYCSNALGSVSSTFLDKYKHLLN